MTTTFDTLTTNALGVLIYTSHTLCDTARKINASIPGIIETAQSISGKITRKLTSPTSIVTDNGWELIDDFASLEVIPDGDVTGDTNDIELMHYNQHQHQEHLVIIIILKEFRMTKYHMDKKIYIF